MARDRAGDTSPIFNPPVDAMGGTARPGHLQFAIEQIDGNDRIGRRQGAANCTRLMPDPADTRRSTTRLANLQMRIVADPPPRCGRHGHSPIGGATLRSKSGAIAVIRFSGDNRVIR